MKKILCVEEDFDTALSTKMVLEMAGHSVETATSGKEAFEKLEQEEYDLALFDTTLADISSQEILKKIGEKQKIAFLSSITHSKTEIMQLKKEGAQGYIDKPYTKNRLLADVALLLREEEHEKDYLR